MAEEKKKKGFFQEFKEFLNRGNVMDLAVGMIIGTAFTAIVTALSNGILKPIINWIISAIAGGDDPLEAAYTFLKKGYEIDSTGAQVLSLDKSIYIDWGAFISAIINFLLVGLILFIIVKAFNKVRSAQEKYLIEQKAKIEARKAELLKEENALETENKVEDKKE